MGMISSWLHPERAYKKAQEQNQAGWNEAKHFQEPFFQNGVDQTGKLTGAENKLLDPAALQNEWAGQYETSPYAQQLLAQNKTSGLDAASSMGLNGSSAALGNIQQGAGNIVSKDRQQYMDDLMKKYMTGIGIGQDIYGQGASAGANLGRGAQQFGETSAGLKYGESAAPGAQFNKYLNIAANAFSNGAFGGGGGADMPAYAQNAIYGA